MCRAGCSRCAATLQCTVFLVPIIVRVPITGPYRDLFGVLGPYLYFRVPIFSVLATFTQRMSIQSAMQSL